MPCYYNISIFYLSALLPLLLLHLHLLLIEIQCTSAQGPPSPGYNPSSKIHSVGFDRVFRNLWGPHHQTVDQGTLTIWLDSISGLVMKPPTLPSNFALAGWLVLMNGPPRIVSTTSRTNSGRLRPESGMAKVISLTVGYWLCFGIWTGSGFKSLRPYQSGYFSAAVKLQPGYTAGVITSFYVLTLSFWIFQILPHREIIYRIKLAKI